VYFVYSAGGAAAHTSALILGILFGIPVLAALVIW